jgi:hypothetical protein
MKTRHWILSLLLLPAIAIGASTTTTALMGLVLPVPGPGGQAGPLWAQNINDAFTALDSHDHTTGKGAQIPTAALNINADVAFGNFNISLPRAVRYTNQSATLVTANDKNQVYVVNGDLYYNNASGTPIKLTSGSGLNAASIGGIGGDYATSTASEFYTSAIKTFTLTQSSGVPAKLSAGDVSISETVASSNAITLKSPTSLGAAYSLTLPTALPASKKIMTVSNTGALAADYDTDNSTLEVNSNALRIKDQGVTQAKMAPKTAVSYSPITSTITIASPAVVTTGSSHGLSVNDPVVFQTTGALPTGLTAGTVYYVTATPSGTTFRIGATAGGADINTSGTQSGTHTEAKVTAAGGIAFSLSSGSSSNTTSTFADVANLSVTITTTGRPVMLMVQPTAASASLSCNAATNEATCEFQMLRNGSVIGGNKMRNFVGASTSNSPQFPTGMMNMVDTPAAGTYTYRVQQKNLGGAGSFSLVEFAALVAYEL